jgi:hypothetical protein
VYGYNPVAGGNGVAGRSDAGFGLYGYSGSGPGAFGESKSADGVVGKASSAGQSGVIGYNPTAGGHGAAGISGSGTGVYGSSVSGNGVVAESVDGTAAKATSLTKGLFAFGFLNGVAGYCLAPTDPKDKEQGVGVLGLSPGGVGVRGVVGVGIGIHGWAVHPDAPSTYAGMFDGDVNVNGTLRKTSDKFLIDHPLDPANKYLEHSTIESSEMKNLYDGVVTLDAGGTATVELPSWFEALNENYRYQLTSIGRPAPDLHVSREISGGRFAIAGGPPLARICWQVTGTRRDVWAKAHPMEVEQEKPERERGLYLYPELHGMPVTKGLRLARNGDLKKDLDELQKEKQALERVKRNTQAQKQPVSIAPPNIPEKLSLPRMPKLKRPKRR